VFSYVGRSLSHQRPRCVHFLLTLWGLKEFGVWCVIGQTWFLVACVRSNIEASIMQAPLSQASSNVRPDRPHRVRARPPGVGRVVRATKLCFPPRMAPLRALACVGVLARPPCQAGSLHAARAHGPFNQYGSLTVDNRRQTVATPESANYDAATTASMTVRALGIAARELSTDASTAVKELQAAIAAVNAAEAVLMTCSSSDADRRKRDRAVGRVEEAEATANTAQAAAEAAAKICSSLYALRTTTRLHQPSRRHAVVR
jgi:hypothetical protein